MSRAARTSALLLVPALLALGACTSASGEIVIGVIGPKSGPLAFVGEQQERGATVAAGEINDEDGAGRRRVRLVMRDDADPARLPAILREFAATRDLVAVIGPEVPAAVLGAQSPLARAKIPVLLPYAPHGQTAEGVFRLWPSDADQAAVLAAWLVGERRIRSVAIAHPSGSAGRAGAEAVAAAVRRAGGRPASREYVPGDLDQTTVVRALRATGAGALVAWGAPADAARIRIAAHRLGWSPQFAGPASLLDASYRSIAGARSDATALVLPARTDWFSPRVSGWFLRYAERFGGTTIPSQRTLIPSIPLVAMSAYDAVRLVARAVERAGDDPSKVAAELARTRDVEGIAARYRFGPGDREAFDAQGLAVARFDNLAFLYDVEAGADREEQIAFYKVQVSGAYLPGGYFRTKSGAALQERLLEEALTDPEGVGFYREYRAPRPPPGPVG